MSVVAAFFGLFLAIPTQVIAQLQAQPADVEICYNRAQQNKTVDAYCGKRWAVINEAVVLEFWEVHELEFYWDSQCSLPFPQGLPIASSVISTFPGNTEEMAWDANLLTKWSSNCRQILGGCTPRSQWVGKNIGDSIPLNKEPVEKFAQVRCTRMYQSPNATRQSSSISIITWENESLTSWHVIYSYGDLAGGAWHTRPAREESLWRIWNMDSMPSPWQVAEVMFFTDLFCEEDKQAIGTPISNGALFRRPPLYEQDAECIQDASCDLYTASKAFDGIKRLGYILPGLEGKWIANCDFWTGCAAKQAWIGLDFDVLPKTVRCIRINQPPHEGYYEVPRWGTPHNTSRVLLQSWDGFKWEDRNIFDGLGKEGGWKDTMPMARTSWRISNFDRILLSWRVYELEMYTNSECSGSRITGESVNSNPALLSQAQQAACWTDLGSCADNAFDGKIETGWESACSPCDQKQAWVGLRFGMAVEIKCFRILQSEDVQHRTDALELNEWMGDHWETRRFESGVGGGTWNRRPSDVSTMWRLLNVVDTERPWTITGMAFYADEACNIPISGEPITNGNEKLYPAQGAFDDFVGSQWITSCTPAFTGHQGCMANSAWLGLQKKEAFKVYCIRLYQTRERLKQAATAVLQVWDGLAWMPSKDHPIFTELGGGAWQVLPGLRASMWRVLADPAPGGHGVGISEITFYRNPDCTDPILASIPNIMPICSGYATSREVGDKTGYTNHYARMGETTTADPMKAFDGQLETFWADIAGDRAWLGLDFSSQVSDVQCIRVAFPGIRALQPQSGELQGWNGNTWRSTASRSLNVFNMDSVLLLPLPSLGGQGFQRRPAPMNSIWKLTNVMPIPAWKVFELEFYTDLACRGSKVVGEPISSAEDADLADLYSGHRNPHKAFDGDNLTFWQAHCIEGASGPVCGTGEAWLGLDLNGVGRKIQCIRIKQSGLRLQQVTTVSLDAWNGAAFEMQNQFNGLGGDTWNRRPMPPDTMWRIAYGERSEVVCRGLEERGWQRSWGVSEVEFYADDGCSLKLPGPNEGVNIVASGTREAGIAPLSGTGPHLAFDGQVTTTWTAQCGAGSRANEEADCREGMEWVGLDFSQKFDGLPVMVRCMKLVQSRNGASDCCDPAKSVTLDRWNGTDWAYATWRHVSDTGQVFSVEGRYGRVAPCPQLSAEQAQAALAGQLSSGIVAAPAITTRSRRQSDVCAIPNAGSVKLLADPFCEKHPMCAQAGYTGNCCPIEEGMSRCCCGFNTNVEVFEDELMDARIAAELMGNAPVGFEMIIIQSATVLPFIGVIAALLFLIIYMIPKPPSSSDGTITCAERMWYRICGPTHRWLQGGGLVPTLLYQLVRRSLLDRWWTLILKRLLILLLGFLIGSMLIWAVLSYLLSEVLTRVVLACSFFIRWSKSRYHPKNPAQKKRMALVLGLPLGDPEGQSLGIKPPNIASIVFAIVQTVVQGLQELVQAMFDVILIRFAFVSIGAVDLQLSAVEIVLKVPNPPTVDVSGLVQVLYDVASVAERFYLAVLSAMFVGAPRCEGPVVILSSCFLIVIALLMVRWLNYDYFGLLTAAKYSAQKTRPTFQKTMAVGATTGVQSVFFIGMQCMMLVCTRAISLVEMDPFKESKGWTCPYPDDYISVLTGRIFLSGMAIITLIITFLCANGHFMGQEYIVRDFSKQIDMDLGKLDPDTKLEGGSIIRTGQFFSMIPTTLGIWIDGWNVKGLLLKERAILYAEELRVPTVCPECGFAHVPYFELMKSSGRQLSLAYQIIPFGAVIGKASERFNNPPLLYWGTELKCLNSMPTLDGVRSMEGRKMTAAQAAKFKTQMGVAFMKDRGVPALQRLAAVAMYLTMLIFTMLLTKENVEDMGVVMFQFITMIAYSKAVCEILLPVLCLAIVGALVVASAVAAKKAAKAAAQPYRVSPVIGQVLHGVTIGYALALFLLQADMGFNLGVAAFIGLSVGGSLSVLLAMACYALELCPNCDLAGGLIKVFVAGLECVGGARIFTLNLTITTFYLAMAMLALVLVPGTNLAFRQTARNPDGSEGPSSLYPLLSTARIMSGPFGVIGGVYGGLLSHGLLVGNFGDELGLLISVGIAFLVGLAYGLATDKMLERPAGKWSVGAGTLAALSVGLLVHWAIGVAVGSVVGSITGALIERRVMKEMDATCMEPPRFTKAHVHTASPNLGPTSNQMAAMRDDNEGAAVIHTNLPTLCRATTPGQLPADDPRWETWKQKEQIQLEWEEQQLAVENEARYDEHDDRNRSGPLAVQDGEMRHEDEEREEADTFPQGDPDSFQPHVPQHDEAEATQQTFGMSQASWHSYGDVPQGNGAWRSSRAQPMPKERKRTSLAASAQNAAKAKSIPPPGPRAVWGGGAGPGGTSASSTGHVGPGDGTG